MKNIFLLAVSSLLISGIPPRAGDCKGLSAVTKNPGDFVLVSDNMVTSLTGATMNSSTVIFKFKDEDAEKSWTGVCEYGTVNFPKSGARFEVYDDGSCYGRNAEGNEIYLLHAKVMPQSEVEAVIKAAGAFEQWTVNLEIKQISASQASHWLFYQSENVMDLALVFPENQQNQEQGKQPRVRKFVFRKFLDQWAVGMESNDSDEE